MTDLAEVWCRWYDAGAGDDEWAEQEVLAGLSAGAWSVQRSWLVVLALLAAAPNDKVLGIIGAGPIEDLLAREPDKVAELIAAEAPGNRPLRLALSHTWRLDPVPEDTFESVKRLAEPFQS